MADQTTLSASRLRWWKSWIIGSFIAITAPWPWSILLAAPFALWAGWTLLDRTCGWCGRRFIGDDWCCDRCAEHAEEIG